MSKQAQSLPDRVDPVRLVRAEGRLSGWIPLRRMRRLGESLLDRDGDVWVDLRFQTDERGLPCVVGELQTELRVVCQRCLEPLVLALSPQVSLHIVPDQAAAERLDAGLEPLIVHGTELVLAELVEDELLLALPQVPTHPAEACAVEEMYRAQPEETTRRENPFAALDALKQRD